MKRTLKWVLIVLGGIVGLVIVVLLVAPLFVDVESYKPVIEEKVSEATGRPFRLAGDLELSLFPWAGFALSDLHIGNPEGFETDDLLSVKSFDVRVKLVPLLSRDVQIKRFVLEGVQVNLEKTKDGRANWEGLGGAPGETPRQEGEPAEEAPSSAPSGLPLKALAVGDFSVSGALLWIDHATGARNEITGLSLKLQDVSLDRPIGLAFAASLDGKPVALDGRIGPLGKDPLSASIPLDLRLSAVDQLNGHLQGVVEALASAQRFDLGLELEPFSPKAMLAALGQELPLTTADPDVLENVALEVKVSGDPTAVSLKDGLLTLDDSRLAFSASARDFSKPDLGFDLELDKIDLDRYLPPAGKEEGGKKKPPAEAPSEEEAEPIDYGPLRKLVLDGTIRVGELKAKNARIHDILLEINAKGGVIRMDPLEAKLYEGTIRADAQADVRGKAPKSRINTRMSGIQAGPLVRDFAGKDIIEGSLQGDVAVNTTGDQPEAVKRSLNGQGKLLFQDGAVVGIDLAGMVRNVQSAFGMAEKQTGDRPKTDFSELSAPFTIRKGVVETPGSQLKSPLLRVLATGTADLVNEVLDFRVDPKVVATLKGQGDTRKRGGIQVPVLVTGTFSSPKFRPDLKGMLEQNLKEGVPDASKIQEMLQPGAKKGGEKDTPSAEDAVKGLLKGFGIGQ